MNNTGINSICIICDLLITITCQPNREGLHGVGIWYSLTICIRKYIRSIGSHIRRIIGCKFICFCSTLLCVLYITTHITAANQFTCNQLIVLIKFYYSIGFTFSLILRTFLNTFRRSILIMIIPGNLTGGFDNVAMGAAVVVTKSIIHKTIWLFFGIGIRYIICKRMILIHLHFHRLLIATHIGSHDFIHFTLISTD